MCRAESCAQLAFLVCWTPSTHSLSSSHTGQGSTFTVLVSLGIGRLGYSDCVEGFFDSCVCVCVFNSCVLFLAEKGKHIFSLLPLNILLPSILYSSDTATSYFPPVKWDRPLFYQLLLLCHIFVLGSWLLAGSQHTRIHPHSRDDIQTFSSLSFPGFCALYRWQSESSQLSLEVRSDRASECKNRGQSEGVWGTQWVTYFMSVFLLSADFCIWTYFCIFLKELFKW